MDLTNGPMPPVKRLLMTGEPKAWVKERENSEAGTPFWANRMVNHSASKIQPVIQDQRSESSVRFPPFTFSLASNKTASDNLPSTRIDENLNDRLISDLLVPKDPLLLLNRLFARVPLWWYRWSFRVRYLDLRRHPDFSDRTKMDQSTEQIVGLYHPKDGPWETTSFRQLPCPGQHHPLIGSRISVANQK